MKAIAIVCATALSLITASTFAAPPDRLPPGLQKKAARGQALPPGWEKKLKKGQKLDREVYDAGRVVVPLDNKGYISIKVDNKIIRLLHATHEIIDVTSSR